MVLLRVYCPQFLPTKLMTGPWPPSIANQIAMNQSNTLLSFHHYVSLAVTTHLLSVEHPDWSKSSIAPTLWRQDWDLAIKIMILAMFQGRIAIFMAANSISNVHNVNLKRLWSGKIRLGLYSSSPPKLHFPPNCAKAEINISGKLDLILMKNY